jgi:hypothetical protein
MGRSPGRVARTWAGRAQGGLWHTAVAGPPHATPCMAVAAGPWGGEAMLSSRVSEHMRTRGHLIRGASLSTNPADGPARGGGQQGAGLSSSGSPDGRRHLHCCSQAEGDQHMQDAGAGAVRCTPLPVYWRCPNQATCLQHPSQLQARRAAHQSHGLAA